MRGGQDEAARLIREAVAELGRRRRAEAIPKDLRRRATKTARALRRQGESWRAVASKMGLASGTVQRWLAAEPKPEFAEVVVREPEGTPRGGVGLGEAERGRGGEAVVVLANGVRVEKLGVAEVIAVLRALG